jgi:hypothetical protein
LLFCLDESIQKVLCSARFILPVTGNRTYSEFLFHPCCTSVIVFVSFSIAAALRFDLLRSEPCYSYALCVSKGLRIHLHESVALLLNFSTCFPLFISPFLGRSFGLVLLHCRSSTLVWQLISLLLRRSEVTLRTDFVNKRSSDS